MFGNLTDANKYLYHYTTSHIVLNHILPSGKARLSPLSLTNDPRESKDWYFSLSSNYDNESVDDYFCQLQMEANNLIKKNCKVLCLTRDNPNIYEYKCNQFGRGYAHPRMWAQYADNHTGVCIMFHRENLVSTIKQELGTLGMLYHGEVQYENQPNHESEAFSLDYSDIQKHGLQKVLKRYITKYNNTFFFKKAMDWQNEWEYRFILIDNDIKSKYFSIKDSIRGLILGVDFPKDYELDISAFSKRYNVPIVRILWRNGHPQIIPLHT
ncbi:MAG: DUF2971 domain-containing protein [Bacillota bacterium]|nr:DUF2971 domain-containing protein [Bacillota bacterium]